MSADNIRICPRCQVHDFGEYSAWYFEDEDLHGEYSGSCRGCGYERHAEVVQTAALVGVVATSGTPRSSKQRRTPYE